MINFKKIKLNNALLIVLIFFFSINIAFHIASAQILDQNTAYDVTGGSRNVQESAGYVSVGAEGIGGIVALAIKAFLGLLGIIFVYLMVLAGYNWMTAAGDEQKVEKAKDQIKRAIIGLIIVVSAYAITYFVLQAMSSVASPTNTVPTSP
jgi:hypothetical protein